MNTLLIITLLLTGISGFVIMLRKDRRIKEFAEEIERNSYEIAHWQNRYAEKLNEISRLRDSLNESNKIIVSLQDDRNQIAYKLNVFDQKINKNKVLVFCDKLKVWGTVDQSKDFLLNSKENFFEKENKITSKEQLKEIEEAAQIRSEARSMLSKEHLKETKTLNSEYTNEQFSSAKFWENHVLRAIDPCILAVRNLNALKVGKVYEFKKFGDMAGEPAIVINSEQNDDKRIRIKRILEFFKIEPRIKKEHPIITSKEQLKETKIRIDNEEEFNKVQDLYYSLGCLWWEYKKIKHENQKWIFVDEDYRMSYSNCTECLSGDPNPDRYSYKEITLKDLGL